MELFNTTAGLSSIAFTFTTGAFIALSIGVIEAWRREYNEERPKKGLNGLTPGGLCKATGCQSRHSNPRTLKLGATEDGGKSAWQRHPGRWSGEIRNWSLAPDFWLNPERSRETPEVLQVA